MPGASLAELHAEAFVLIAAFVDASDIGALSATCSGVRSQFDNPALWARLLVRDFADGASAASAAAGLPTATTVLRNAIDPEMVANMQAAASLFGDDDDDQQPADVDADADAAAPDGSSPPAAAVAHTRDMLAQADERAVRLLRRLRQSYIDRHVGRVERLERVRAAQENDCMPRADKLRRPVGLPWTADAARIALDVFGYVLPSAWAYGWVAYSVFQVGVLIDGTGAARSEAAFARVFMGLFIGLLAPVAAVISWEVIGSNQWRQTSPTTWWYNQCIASHMSFGWMTDAWAAYGSDLRPSVSIALDPLPPVPGEPQTLPRRHVRVGGGVMRLRFRTGAGSERFPRNHDRDGDGRVGTWCMGLSATVFQIMALCVACTWAQPPVMRSVFTSRWFHPWMLATPALAFSILAVCIPNLVWDVRSLSRRQWCAVVALLGVIAVVGSATAGSYLVCHLEHFPVAPPDPSTLGWYARLNNWCWEALVAMAATTRSWITGSAAAASSSTVDAPDAVPSAATGGALGTALAAWRGAVAVVVESWTWIRPYLLRPFAWAWSGCTWLWSCVTAAAMWMWAWLPLSRSDAASAGDQMPAADAAPAVPYPGNGTHFEWRFVEHSQVCPSIGAMHSTWLPLVCFVVVLCVPLVVSSCLSEPQRPRQRRRRCADLVRVADVLLLPACIICAAYGLWSAEQAALVVARTGNGFPRWHALPFPTDVQTGITLCAAGNDTCAADLASVAAVPEAAAANASAVAAEAVAAAAAAVAASSSSSDEWGSRGWSFRVIPWFMPLVVWLLWKALNEALVGVLRCLQARREMAYAWLVPTWVWRHERLLWEFVVGKKLPTTRRNVLQDVRRAR